MQEKEEKIKTSSEEQKENQNIVIIYIIQVYYMCLLLITFLSWDFALIRNLSMIDCSGNIFQIVSASYV